MGTKLRNKILNLKSISLRFLIIYFKKLNAMNTDILNELPYGVTVCQNDGTMLYTNQAASIIFNCPSGNLINYNILTFIDGHFHDKLTSILKNPEDAQLMVGRDFIFVKLKDISSKIYKVKFKRFEVDNILIMIYDYTSNKIDRDNLIKNISQLNDYVSKNNLVLKTISNMCKNIFYKDRSALSDILVGIATSFKLVKAAICFKNGTRHLIYCKKLNDGSYNIGKLDGTPELTQKKCAIWENEKNHVHEKDLIFQIPCNMTCVDLVYNNTDYADNDMHILKLKLDNNTVVGFLEFVEDEQFQLSTSDLEILESLSQILAYIINNKEQVEDVNNYIRSKFSNISIK